MRSSFELDPLNEERVLAEWHDQAGASGEIGGGDAVWR